MGERFSVILDKRLEKLLTIEAKRKGISKANVFRNAIVVLNTLENELDEKNNRRVAIVDDKGCVEAVVVLPQ